MPKPTLRPVEVLEERCVPDGNVVAFTDGLDNLIIQGDGANNTIVIERLGTTNALMVRGLNGTLVNGTDTPFTALIATGTQNSVRVNMNAGNDTVILQNISQNNVPGNLSINFGRGGASLWVNNVQDFLGNINVLSGDGSFFTKWTNFSISGAVTLNANGSWRSLIQMQVGDPSAGGASIGQFADLTIRTGRGNDTLTLRGKLFENVSPPRLEPLLVGGRLLVDTDSGNDVLRTEFLEVLGSANFRLGAGADQVDMLEGQVLGTAAFQLAAGNDSLSVQGTVFQRGVDILTGGTRPDQDNISLGGLNINGNLKIVTGDDDDTVSLIGTQIANLPGTTQGQLLIQTGRGQDYVELINASIAREMVIQLGPDNDAVSFGYTDVGGRATIDGGPGTNILSRIGLRAPRGLTIINFP